MRRPVDAHPIPSRAKSCPDWMRADGTTPATTICASNRRWNGLAARPHGRGVRPRPRTPRRSTSSTAWSRSMRPDWPATTRSSRSSTACSVLGGYRAMGRVYRGIIEPSLRQYVHLGDAATMTDNVFQRPVEGLGLDANGDPVRADDRWVFTEDNPGRELYVAAGLAGGVARPARRAIRTWREETLAAAEALLRRGDRPQQRRRRARLRALRADPRHRTAGPGRPPGRARARDPRRCRSRRLADRFDPAADPGRGLQAAPRRRRRDLSNQASASSARTDSPYGVPYRPDIWGAGWTTPGARRPPVFLPSRMARTWRRRRAG